MFAALIIVINSETESNYGMATIETLINNQNKSGIHYISLITMNSCFFTTTNSGCMLSKSELVTVIC